MIWINDRYRKNIPDPITFLLKIFTCELESFAIFLVTTHDFFGDVSNRYYMVNL